MVVSKSAKETGIKVGLCKGGFETLPYELFLKYIKFTMDTALVYSKPCIFTLNLGHI